MTAIMIVSVQACATAQCCTREAKAITITVSMTFHLTSTLSSWQLVAIGGSVLQ